MTKYVVKVEWAETPAYLDTILTFDAKDEFSAVEHMMRSKAVQKAMDDYDIRGGDIGLILLKKTTAGGTSRVASVYSVDAKGTLEIRWQRGYGAKKTTGTAKSKRKTTPSRRH